MAAFTAFLHITVFGHGNSCWACQVFPKVSLLFFCPQKSSLPGLLAECGYSLDPLWAQMVGRSLVSLWCIFNEVKALSGPEGEMAMWLQNTWPLAWESRALAKCIDYMHKKRSAFDWIWTLKISFVLHWKISKRRKSDIYIWLLYMNNWEFTQKWNIITLKSFQIFDFL